MVNGNRLFSMRNSNPGKVVILFEYSYRVNRLLFVLCIQFNRSHWKEVDGLQNSQVTVVITSTAVRTNEYLRSRIVPSIRTWMKDFVNVYVIIEDTTEVRFDFRHCKFFDSPHFTSFSCPNEIKYILTRKCTSDYYIGNIIMVEI